MTRASVPLLWTLLVVSLCTLTYAANTPDARNSVIVGGENGADALVRGMHFGRELLTSRSERKVRKSRRKKKTRNCNGRKSIVNRIRSRGGSGGGGGSGVGLGSGGDGGDGGDSLVEPQNVNLCVSGESRRNNKQRISISLD